MRYNFFASAMTFMALVATETVAYDPMTESMLQSYDGSAQSFETLAQMLVKSGVMNNDISQEPADAGLGGQLDLAQGEVEATSLADILMEADMDDIFDEDHLAQLMGEQAPPAEKEETCSDEPSSSESSSNGFSASDSSD